MIKDLCSVFAVVAVAVIAAAPATHADAQGMQDMPGMDMGGPMMKGETGNYSMMRDASGTSWQPDSTPMEGIQDDLWGWSTMMHGYIDAVDDHQGGPRGGNKTFSESMLMAMAQSRQFLSLRTRCRNCFVDHRNR